MTRHREPFDGLPPWAIDPPMGPVLPSAAVTSPPAAMQRAYPTWSSGERVAGAPLSAAAAPCPGPWPEPGAVRVPGAPGRRQPPPPGPSGPVALPPAAGQAAPARDARWVASLSDRSLSGAAAPPRASGPAASPAGPPPAPLSVRRPGSARPPRGGIAAGPANGVLHRVPPRGEATQLAVMFALDYLSFDEDDPQRRHQVVQRYLPDEVSGRLGWDGLGRQLADVAVPGAIDVVGACVWFDLQVRVTPYHRIGGQLAPPLRPQGPSPARAASAPAPMGLRWAPAAARWVRLWVPVRRGAGGALVVDPAVAVPETRQLPLPDGVPPPSEGGSQDNDDGAVRDDGAVGTGES